MSNRLAAALRYAVLGWSLILLHTARQGTCSCGRADCHSVGKHPCIPFEEATNDTTRIEYWFNRWPDANIGVHVGKSNLVVIDIDYRHGGQVEDLPISPYSLSSTPTADTPGGGIHIFYEAPTSFNVSNSSARLPQGTDIRAQNAYVVVEPSMHQSGRRYAWHPNKEPWNLHPLPLPADFYPLLKIKGEPAQAPVSQSPVIPKTQNGQRHPYVEAALQGELKKLAQAVVGMRNSSLNESAFALGQFVEAGLLSRGEVEQVLTATALTIGLGEVETASTIRSGVNAGIENPRLHWPSSIRRWQKP